MVFFGGLVTLVLIPPASAGEILVSQPFNGVLGYIQVDFKPVMVSDIKGKAHVLHLGGITNRFIF